MSEGWSVKEAARHSGLKCLGCTGTRLHGAVCCSSCWKRVPTDLYGEWIKVVHLTGTDRARRVVAGKIMEWLKSQRTAA